VDNSGRNSPKHIFIPVTSESVSATRIQSSAANICAESAADSQSRHCQPSHNE